jgi:putative ribosome biogenesis GTPase RsgA
MRKHREVEAVIRQPEPHVAMLDRFLVIAEANGLAGRVVVNKVDLADEGEARRLFATYEILPVPTRVVTTAKACARTAAWTSVITGP